MTAITIASSNPKAPGYEVQLDGPEGPTCECKAFEYSTAEPPTCKHITKARELVASAEDDADREMGIDTSHKE